MSHSDQDPGCRREGSGAQASPGTETTVLIVAFAELRPTYPSGAAVAR